MKAAWNLSREESWKRTRIAVPLIAVGALAAGRLSPDSPFGVFAEARGVLALLVFAATSLSMSYVRYRRSANPAASPQPTMKLSPVVLLGLSAWIAPGVIAGALLTWMLHRTEFATTVAAGVAGGLVTGYAGLRWMLRKVGRT